MLHRDDLKVSRRTGFVADERFYWHHAGVITSGCDIASFNPGGGEFVQPNSGSQGYFENESTKRRMANLIDVCGLMEKLDTVTVKKRAAQKEELCYFHSRVYVDKVEDMSCRNGGDAGDVAFFGPGSYNIAALAAGCCIEAVNSVLDQALDNAYVLCRPPGHHAERDRGMGFCLFNNIAIAAEHAVRNRGKKRVAIVDWDVHHGNGTQQAFFERSDVLFISVHQDNLYPPSSGSLNEVGAGDGEGFTINIPLPPGAGDGAYKRVMEAVILPSLKKFDPEIILVSCGFDASFQDPLGCQMVTSLGFQQMARDVLSLDIPIVFCHEGGYSPEHVPYCGLRVVEEMAGLEKSNVNFYDDGLNYGYQACQKWQEDVVQKVCELHAL
jgi:acetoin utilization deacetylase AcuC-like enzyme